MALLLVSGTEVVAQSPCLQSTPAASATQPHFSCNTPYKAEERLKDYFKNTVGLRAHLASATVAGIQQARNAPSAWEQGMEGYGRRYGSYLAKRATSNTVQLGVEAMLGEDSRYAYSERSGFWLRMKDAVIHSLVIRNAGGGREVAIGRVAGAIAGGLLSRTWQPEGHRGIGQGFRSGGIAFGGYVTGNIFREFARGLDKHLPF